MLEPYAVAELLRWFSDDLLGAQGFIEERNFFSDRLGETLFDEKVTLTDNGLYSVNFPSFDFEDASAAGRADRGRRRAASSGTG